MADKGYFVITDISGYTEYLTESELDHAQAILQSLFDSQIQNVAFPLRISGFRGDAIFMYTPDASFVNPQSFIETLENLYIVFTETLRQMEFNTVCECKACRNIGKLDLKMCIHYGDYIVQDLGGHQELLGADVIVPHRMLKNNVIEATGIDAYALFSEAAAAALGLQNLCTPLVSHRETYEHLGELNLLVYDLRAAWDRAQARQSHLVDPDTAWIEVELEVPYPPSVIWDYLTVPSLEASMFDLVSVTRTDLLGGRTRPESTFHCAHSSGDFINKIVDWKPFDHYTTLQSAAGLEFYKMVQMTPSAGGTRLLVVFSRPEGGTDGIRAFFEPMIREGYQRIASFIRGDVERGVLVAG
jgi:hypothetical protein